MAICRYGYGSAEFYGQILNGYGNASIPLETFVSDSQYMDHDQDFTLGYQFPLAQMKVCFACSAFLLGALRGAFGLGMHCYHPPQW